MSNRMTNLTGCNKGALVHRKRRMSVPPLAHLSNTQSPSKLSKHLELLLLLHEHPYSLWIHQTDALKGRNGDGGGRASGGGGGFGVSPL